MYIINIYVFYCNKKIIKIKEKIWLINKYTSYFTHFYLIFFLIKIISFFFIIFYDLTLSSNPKKGDRELILFSFNYTEGIHFSISVSIWYSFYKKCQLHLTFWKNLQSSSFQTKLTNAVNDVPRVSVSLWFFLISLIFF